MFRCDDEGVPLASMELIGRKILECSMLVVAFTKSIVGGMSAHTVCTWPIRHDVERVERNNNKQLDGEIDLYALMMALWIVLLRIRSKKHDAAGMTGAGAQRNISPLLSTEYEEFII
jgi:hypothetical protein